jgi:hypothetical protein
MPPWRGWKRPGGSRKQPRRRARMLRALRGSREGRHRQWPQHLSHPPQLPSQLRGLQDCRLPRSRRRRWQRRRR